MMPCTTERPRPVPSPTGLVVKNGSKSRAAVAWSMPQPVSLTLSRTAAPDDGSAPAGTGAVSTVIVPRPPAMACPALVTRLITICRSCPASPMTGGTLEIRPSSVMVAGRLARSSFSAERVRSARSTARRLTASLRLKARMRPTRSRARSLACRIISRLLRSRLFSGRARAVVLASAKTGTSVLLSSWAMPPASVPNASSFCECSSWRCISLSRLGRPLLGHVLEDRQVPRGLSRVIEKHFDVAADDAHIAVGPHHAHLAGRWASPGGGHRDRLLYPGAILLMDEAQDIAFGRRKRGRIDAENAVGLRRPFLDIAGE